MSQRIQIKLRASRALGFSLVELMTALAVLAIMAAIAVPSFTSIINGNRLVSQSNEMVAAFQSARSEAVKRNSRVILCRTTDQAACAGDGTWNAWLVGADANRDGNVDEVIRVGEIKAPVQVANSDNIQNARIVFRPDGRAHQTNGALLNGALQICMETRKPVQNVRVVQIASGSRISSLPPVSGGGECPDAPPNQ